MKPYLLLYVDNYTTADTYEFYETLEEADNAWLEYEADSIFEPISLIHIASANILRG